MNAYKDYRAAMMANLVPLIAILISTVFVIIFIHPQAVMYNDEITYLTGSWHGADGSDYSIGELPAGDITLTYSLTGVDIYRKRLCFKSTDTFITAEFDGVKTYEYAPQQASILGKSYGQYIHMILIPADAQSVTLILHPVYGGSAKIKEIAIEDAGIFVGHIYHDGLPIFALCTFIALYGVLMIILGFTNRHYIQNSRVNFFSLGSLAILTGIWSANDTLILQTFSHHPEIVRFVNYLCLMFIVYPPVSFMAAATGNSKTILLPILKLLTAANFVITMTLTVLGIADFREMLSFSHVNVAVAMVMTMYLIIRAVKSRTIDKSYLRTISIGMTIAVIGAGIDLIRFVVGAVVLFDSGLFTRTGIMVFILLMGLHLMRERTRLAVEHGQSELMRRMAYTDGLTGLANRAAFHEREALIRQNRTECAVIQLDINFLKKVNDDFGHAEGDRHIIASANIIKQSFDSLGTAFRTGGDEFIVIASTKSEKAVKDAIAQMEKLITEYNEKNDPPVPLGLAYGYAFFTASSNTIEEVEKLSDDRMYEKKRQMKGMREN